MKTFLLLILFVTSILNSHAQTGINTPWTFVAGDTVNHLQPVYGVKGVPATANTPGGRDSYSSWTDKAGNFWVFGGNGISAKGYGVLNDLWRYNPVTNQWTWMNGGDSVSAVSHYGTQGVAAAANMPGSRYTPASWTDTAGNLWMYGGFGFINVSGGPTAETLADLWKYNIATNKWTWAGGDSLIRVITAYGVLGVANSNNTPGNRQSPVAWADKSNNLWLFGGSGFSINAFGNFNDLWKYNIANKKWTWMKGDTTMEAGAVYGTPGVEDINNKPSATSSSTAAWTDSNGNFWLFGGINRSNTLWKYNPANNKWTWVNGDTIMNASGNYGTLNVSSAANQPPGRSLAISWRDNSGDLWMFGGYVYAAFNGYNSYRFNKSDLWKYTLATNQWTWIKGDSSKYANGIYGVQGVANAANKPGARNGYGWTDNTGKLWLFGGEGYAASGSGTLNDMWQYNPSTNNWTWEKGDTLTGVYPVYGTRGLEAAVNNPGKRFNSITWKDNSGKFWLYGGYTTNMNSGGIMDDMWRLDPASARWTWTKGSNNVPYQAYDLRSHYGTAGVEDPANSPGVRAGSYTWVDATGNLWMFGGFHSGPRVNVVRSDLWRYNPATANWTWMKGDTIPFANANYGTIGVPSSSNKPGPLTSGSSWKDNAGNFWMFGGSDFSYPDIFYHNALWKYEIGTGTGTWIWMKGGNTSNNTGQYGIIGMADPSNTPGGRTETVSWTDNAGNFWLFGGTGFDAGGNKGQLNDLWKYDVATNQWIWMKGDNTINSQAVFGVKGISSANNKPEARYGSLAWADDQNNLWLYGGLNSFRGVLGDLWKYNIVSNEWAWVKGDSTVNIPPVYTGADSKPGAKYFSAGWKDNTGNFWLYSGNSINDLWKISSSALLPLSMLKLSAAYVENNVNVKWTTTNEVNVHHFEIERISDDRTFITIGTQRAAGNGRTNDYIFTDTKPLSGINYYRLKVFDADGSFYYSDIVSVKVNAEPAITISPNPFKNSLQVTIQSCCAEMATLQVKDLKGVTLLSQKQPLQKGRNIISITHTGQLPPATYLLSVITNEKTTTIKVIKE